MTDKQNKNEAEAAIWIPACMCIGAALGSTGIFWGTIWLTIGIAMGTSFGLSAGVMIMALSLAHNKSKQNEDEEQPDQSSE